MSLPTESTSRANGTARSEIHRSVLEHGQLAVHVYWPGHQLRQALEGQHVVMYAGPCLPVLQQLGEELLQRGGVADHGRADARIGLGRGAAAGRGRAGLLRHRARGCERCLQQREPCVRDSCACVCAALRLSLPA